MLTRYLRRLLGIALAIVLGAGQIAHAQAADPPACAPYRAKWASVAASNDVAAMEETLKVVPTVCPVLRNAAQAKLAGARPAGAGAAQVTALRQQLKNAPAFNNPEAYTELLDLMYRYPLPLLAEAARQGDARAATLAGYKTRMQKEALAYSRQGCDGGVAPACASALQTMNNMQSKDAAGKAALRGRACELGAGYYCFDMGRTLIRGFDGVTDVKKGLVWLERGCDMLPPDKFSCAELASLYFNGSNGVTRDVERARGYYGIGCATYDDIRGNSACKAVNFGN